MDQIFHEGVAHHQAGRLAEAERCYRLVLSQQPGHVDARQLLGVIAHQAGRNDVAIQLISEAIAINPNVGAFHNNLGAAQQAVGDLDAAAASYRRALALTPKSPDAPLNLVRVLWRQGKVSEAAQAGWAAMDGGHDAAPLVIDIIVALNKEFRFDESIPLAQAAVQKRPDDARLVVALGNTLHAAGQLREALEHYDRATELLPDAGEAHWNKALLLLTMGDYPQGWKEYEWRWRCAGFPYKRQNFPQPTWDGSDLMGKAILLDSEGGFGDIIQFIRYAPLVAARGGRVILGAPPALKELLLHAEDIHQLVTRGDVLPPFDVQLQLLSCPLIFQTTLETIPNPGPYVAASPAKIEMFAERIGRDQNVRQVGLVWCGRSAPYPNRSCPLSRCAALFEIPGVRFHSLQRDDGRAELAGAPARWQIVDHGDELADFADTAGLVANLDLIITIDSAVAHLAGAMGKPVWVMVPHSPDWRWMADRDDCPWYPGNMRLFRQTAANDWAGVIARVAAALRQFQLP